MRLKAALDKDRRLNVRLIASEVGLPKCIVHKIVPEDLNKWKNSAKLVKKIVIDEQKQNRIFVCQELDNRLSTEQDLLG